MTERAIDPRRLDVAALAAAGVPVGGAWPLSGFKRLPQAPAQPGSADWTVRPSLRRPAGGAAEPWLALSVVAPVRLTCQRCLQDLELPLRIESSFRFVSDEEQAATLDADAEEDVLALPQRLDLHELVEDEILLALPLVPMHETCPEPLLPPQDDVAVSEPDSGADGAAHPFAALRALKRH